MSKTLTLTALCKHTGIKPQTLYRMIEDNRFPVEPITGTKPRLWNIDKVNEWMNNDR